MRADKRHLLVLALAAYTAVSLLALLLESETVAPSTWPSAPLSLARISHQMAKCDASLQMPAVLLRPATSQRAIAKKCLKMARAVIVVAPTHAHAHLVAAQSLIVLDDPKSAKNELRRSQKAAPFEGWLAERRFIAAQFLASRFDLRKLLTNESSALLTNQHGAETLAVAYLSRPTLRPTIEAAARKARPKDRVRLANLLRKRVSAP